MVVPPDTDVSETVETAQNQNEKLIGLGVSSHYAATIAYDRKGYWFNAGNKAVNWALSKRKTDKLGLLLDLAAAYQSLSNY